VNNLASSAFGQIQATRTARGDLGSSRQLQLGLKLIFWGGPAPPNATVDRGEKTSARPASGRLAS
jgi:hypothetical protein